MAHRKTTSKKVATKASKVLRDKRASKNSKSAARGALPQKHGKKKDKPPTGNTGTKLH